MRLDQIVRALIVNLLATATTDHTLLSRSQITSCFFAMVQTACGDEAEEDASFAFTLESATFKIPLVRFSYE